MLSVKNIQDPKLNRITILESTKLYFTKEIDKVNKKERAFINYKQFVVSVSAIILDINLSNFIDTL